MLSRSHNLREQVEDLKRVARAYRTSVSTKLIDLLEAFDDADPSGMWSRFPISKRWKATHILDPDSSFDLQEFKSRCEGSVTELEDLLHEIERQDYEDDIRDQIEDEW